MEFSNHIMNVFVTITVSEVEKWNKVDVYNLHICQPRLVRPLEYSSSLRISYGKIHFMHMMLHK